MHHTLYSISPTAVWIYNSNLIKSEEKNVIKEELHKNKKLITKTIGIDAEYINPRQKDLFTPK